MRATTSNLPLPPGHQLLWYEIKSVLGEGGFGITYLATDRNLHHEVAVKEYFPRESCARDTLLEVSVREAKLRAQYEWGLARFVEEARTLAQFRHPNIVHVRTAFELNATAYMVMDLERGRTLGDLAKEEVYRNEDAALALAGPLLHGLDQVHEAGFIHRDIKPGNIIIRDDGTPVLVDFGSSRLTAGHKDQTLTALVTRGFAPFEQYASEPDNQRQGPWGDIYSFAAVLYVLVAGRAPPDAVQRGALLVEDKPDPLVPARDFGGGRFSDELLNAIDAGLAFSSSARPQSVRDWIRMFPEPLPFAPTGSTRTSAQPPRQRSPVTGYASFSERVTEQSPDSPIHVSEARSEELSTIRLLIVDDEAYVRALTRRILERIGVVSILTATNGREALARIDECPDVDVVLLDLRMGDMDGIEFLRELSGTGHRPSIILASGVDTMLLRSAEAFARSNGFAVLGSADKPVRPESLRVMLRHFVDTATIIPSRRAPVTEISEDELIEGLHADALVPFYQPKIAVASQAIVGVEALARWKQPSGEMLGPGSFIPLAERTRHIHELTLRILRLALADCGEWHAAGFDLDVALNVSAASFTDLAFPDFLESEAGSQGVPTSQITLEVTERMVADDILAMMDILMRLRIKGLTLSIDDFGTGYSSLQQLHRLPFTELKIDRAFVSGAAQDTRAHSILEASVALARKLGMSTTAEGVESHSDWRAVSAVGCDRVQGFLIAKPMPREDLLAWLAKPQKTPL